MYAVVIHADFTLVVEAVGPFRSHAKAAAVAERIDAAYDKRGLADMDGVEFNGAPQIVRFSTETEFMERYLSDEGGGE